MLDGNDIDFVILAFSPTTLPGFLVWITVIIIMCFVVAGNKEKCAEMHCDNGSTARLLDDECLCVEQAK